MPCPRTQQANLPACSPQPSRNAKRQAGKLRIPFFKVFWYDSTRGMNPRSTDYKADALTATPYRLGLEGPPQPSNLEKHTAMLSHQYLHTSEKSWKANCMCRCRKREGPRPIPVGGRFANILTCFTCCHQ